MSRILGFSKKWPKLQNPEYTTFRYPRKDSDRGRDWHIGETVQIVFHPRGKDREFLGTAEILGKERRYIGVPMIGLGYIGISDKEAEADGFVSIADMRGWMTKTYGNQFSRVMNKLTLQWIKRAEVSCQ